MLGIRDCLRFVPHPRVVVSWLVVATIDMLTQAFLEALLIICFIHLFPIKKINSFDLF